MALRVADDMAIRRIGRVIRDPGGGEGRRIEAGIVKVAVVDQAGPVRNGAVKNRTGQVVVAEEARLPACPPDHRSVLSARMGGHDRGDLAQGLAVVKLRRLDEVGAAVQEMDMRILKAGEDEATARIDDLGPVGGMAQPFRVARQGEDAAVADKDRPRGGAGGVHRADIGVLDQHIRHRCSASRSGQSLAETTWAGDSASRVQP